MDFDPAELDTLSREDLILRARARGVERPEQMTRVELRDEIVRLSEPDLERQRRSRGWLGVARDLLASVVESGLNLPDAAAAIRGDLRADVELGGPPPVATVTLAEIYAAQGHYDKALRMLDEVLEREPDHAQALNSRKRLLEERELGPGRRRRSEAAVPAPAVVEEEPAVASEPAAGFAAPEPARAAIVAEAVAEAAVEAFTEALAAVEAVAEVVAEAVAEVAAEAVAEVAAEAVAEAVAEATGAVDTLAAIGTAAVAVDEPAAAATSSNGEPALLVLHAA
ncbi:MAG TPA: tetratricopeptide repeat protein, partial [Polyangiaceae bacterium]|nr:tetratricopeptide repeat protein [Polyangiaceae bacterium]